MIHTTTFKIAALLLAAVLTIVAGTPAKAEALDALTILAIASLVTAGIVLIAYLVVANVEGDKQASSDPRTVWMACAASDDGCTTIPAETATALMEPVVDTADRQGP